MKFGLQVPISRVEVPDPCADFRDQNLGFPCFRDHDDPLRLSRLKRRWRDKTIATIICHFQSFATKNFRRDFPDQDGRIQDSNFRRDFPDHVAQETVRPVRPNSDIFRLSRPRWRPHDFSNQHGDGATKKKYFKALATEVETGYKFLFHGSRSQTHVQTFATKTWVFHAFATMMIRCDFRD